MEIQLLTQNKDITYLPIVEEGIDLETERKGSPGKLTFKIHADDNLKILEGNSVAFRVDNKKMFYGFVFSKKRSKDKIMSVTAYDQLRYFKNKDTYVYTNKRADQVVKMIANDFLLKTGTLEDTEYVIAKRIESNQTLFDISYNALDLTLENKKEIYVLYDDFGEINLKNIERLKLGLVIDEETGQDYDYSSSIDSNTYNRIKLTYDNSETGKREVYISQDSSNINEWGMLQFFETIDEKTNGKVKADTLLKLYNQKTRNLQIKEAFGDTRVRGGSSVVVNMKFDDVKLQNFMLVEKVKHTFKNNEHTMNLTLRGQDFVA